MKIATKNNILLALALLTGLVVSSIMLVPSSSVLPNNDNSFNANNGDDEDDDGVDDEEEEENDREIEIDDNSENETEIRSILDNETVNEIIFTINTDESLKIKFEYGTEENDTEHEMEFEVNFKEIVEYVDENADHMFNESIDDEIGTYEILNFLPIGITFSNDTMGAYYVLNATTADGIFSAILYVSNEFTKINDVLIAPTMIKIDIRIIGYQYTEVGSELALNVELETEAEAEYESETEDETQGRSDNESEIKFNLADYKGFFSWSENATIDGVIKPVMTNPHEIEGAELEMFLNYQRGDEIIHDPKIGIEGILIQPHTTTPTNQISLSLFTLSGILLLSTISVLAIIFVKKWRK